MAKDTAMPPPPRLTGWGWTYLLAACAAVMAVLLALDLLIWAIFRFGLDRCYGIWCWL